MKAKDKISIAVLPFKNMSHESSNEYFCDGMSEEIIHALSKIEQLKVISRTSAFTFKGKNVHLKEIAEQLRVSLILNGSVRLGGEMMRIAVELVDTQSSTTLWTKSWDRPKSEVFTTQDEISLLLADIIREQLGHLDIQDHLALNQTNNIEAYEAYLRGKFHFTKWNPEDCHKAVRLFQQSIQMAPDFIDAMVGLADAYSFLAVAGFAPPEESWQKAREVINKAKKLDGNHAGLNNILANDAFFTEANFSKALGYIKKALREDPNHTESHRFITFLYSICGDFKKAKAHISYAKSLDPLNPETIFFEANYYYRAGELEKAAIIIDELLKQNDKNLPALIVSINIKLIQNKLPELNALIHNTPKELFAPDELLGIQCLLELAEGNDSAKCLADIVRLASSNTAHHAHAYLFTAYVRSAQHEKAAEVLNRLFTDASSILLIHFSDPLNASFQNHADYKSFHQKIYPLPTNESNQLPKAKREISIDKDKIDLILSQLEVAMKFEKVYLNPDLSLRLLANQLDIHSNLLSKVINHSIGKNYNDYINGHRIEHFKQLVTDPKNRNISLLGLAYESGFNSKTVFNTAFKKLTGVTPKTYQKEQLNA